MGRVKGAKNKEKSPEIFSMTTDDRITLLANIIVDAIADKETREAIDAAMAKEAQEKQ